MKQANSIFNLLIATAIVSVLPNPVAVGANCPDLDSDGDVDIDDVFIAIGEMGSCPHPCPFDMDGDEDVDKDDVQFVADSSGTCADFEFHWNATGGEADAIVLDAALECNTHRDVISLNQAYFGNFPTAGLHVMFGTPATYSNWESNYAQYLADHEQAVTDDANDLPSGFDGYAVIDYETWHLIWDRMQTWGSSITTDWQTFVASINTPNFDQDFLDLVNYVPPGGTFGWLDLTPSQKRSFLDTSWEAIAKIFYLSTLTTAQTAQPDVKWGFYNLPQAIVPEHCDGSGSPTLDDLQDWNDQLSWLWGAVDVFLPSVYQLWYAVNGSQSGQNEIPASDNFTYMRCSLQEAVRLRDTIGIEDVKILPYVTPTYTENARPTYDAHWVNKINRDHQLRYVRYFGGDGVIMWGNITCEDCPSIPACCSDASCCIGCPNGAECPNGGDLCCCGECCPFTCADVWTEAFTAGAWADLILDLVHPRHDPCSP